MNILAIDTATGPCSVALWKNGGISAYVENVKPIMQSASLLPMIEEALAISNLTYKNLSAIACTIGPGSFTGIRVGLASARGIAFAAGIKTLGFTTLEVLAFAARKDAETVLAIVNAGKGEVFYQAYKTDPWQSLYESALGTLEKATASVDKPHIIGYGTNTIAFPRADALAELAATRAASAQALKPFYIRPPDAKLPQKKPLPSPPESLLRF